MAPIFKVKVSPTGEFLYIYFVLKKTAYEDFHHFYSLPNVIRMLK
jgi:hypothetical protein